MHYFDLSTIVLPRGFLAYCPSCCCGLGTQNWSGLSILKQLEAISPAYICGIPPKLAFIWCDHLDGSYLDGSHTLRDDPVCHGEGSESSFLCRSFLHALVVVLRNRQVCFHLEAQPGCYFVFESYRAITNSSLHFQLSLVVQLAALCTSHQCRLRVHCIQLQPSLTLPLNALYHAILMFSDDLIDVAFGCHPAKVIHEKDSICRDLHIDTLNQSWDVD